MPKHKKVARDREGRFICPHCKRPMSSVLCEFIEFDRWRWNPVKRIYEKEPTSGRKQCLCGFCRKEINPAVCEVLETQDDTGNYQDRCD